jgi:hypothetical protein
MNLKSFSAALLAAGCVLTAGAAQAAVIAWTDWDPASAALGDPGSIDGVAGTVGVSYDGEVLSFLDNYPSWTPTTTWADGTIVENAPPSSGGILRIVGGVGDQANTNTITFSQAVLNPVIAIWSLGQSGTPASFVFNLAPTFVDGGPSAEYGGNPITVLGNTVSGIEGNGTIQFQGSVTSITFVNPQSEDWYGFTVGIGGVAVPEPTTWALMIGGFGMAGAVLRRRRSVVAAA